MQYYTAVDENGLIITTGEGNRPCLYTDIKSAQRTATKNSAKVYEISIGEHIPRMFGKVKL